MDPVAQIYHDRDEAGREATRHHKKPPARFRCSELSDCARRIWYRHSGYVPTPRYGHSEDYAMCGDFAHDSIRFAMRAHGAQLSGLAFNDIAGTVEELDKNYNFKVEHEGETITFSGRGDGRIYLPDIAKLALLEVKSLGNFKYLKLQRAYSVGGLAAVRKVIDDNHPGFLYQTTAMMKILELDYAYLAFVDRSDCWMGLYDKERVVRHGGYEYSFEQDIWEKVKGRCAYIAKRVKSGEPPMPAHVYSSKECSYCPFKYLCRGAEYRRKKGAEPVVLYPDPTIDIEVDPNGKGVL